MKQQHRLNLAPSLLVGLGIIVATIAAKLAAESGWWVMAGPALLALSVVGADLLDARRRGGFSGPSPAALLLGATFLLAGFIVALRDPSLVKLLIPVIGAGCWVTLLARSDGSRRACRST